MSTILDLRPVAVPGWRVAVALGVPEFNGSPEQVTITEVPLVGWARTRTAHDDVLWLPCWWDDLGLTVGNPWQEIAWPLGPGEDLTGDLRTSLVEEAEALLARKKP